MKNILSKQSKRYLNTLEYLYYHDYCSLNKLADLSKVSIHTIYEDINKLNQLISPISIIKNELNECFLSIPDNLSCDYFYSKVLNDSLEFSLIESIFFEEKDTLEDYANTLFVSLSTLKRTISRINKHLRPNEVQISTNPIRIVGNEKKIRNYMFCFFREKYIDFNYPFNQDQEQLFEILLNYIVDQKKEFMNFPDMEKIQLIMAISLIRVKNGHYCPSNCDCSLIDTKKISLTENPQLIKVLKKQFPTTCDLSNVEILAELLFPLFCEHYYFDFTQLTEAKQKDPQVEQEATIIITLINNLCKILNTSLSKELYEKLILTLLNVRLLAVGEIFLIYNPKKDFIFNLKADFPLIHNFLASNVLDSPVLGNYTLYEREQVVYLLLTHWPGLFFKIQDSVPTLNVGICMTSDNEHSELIASILDKRFDHHFKFIPIYFINHKNVVNEFGKYDFIITNISEPLVTGHKVISINLYPSEKDFNKIHSMYVELHSSEQIS